jgi:hypothetical protein
VRITTRLGWATIVLSCLYIQVTTAAQNTTFSQRSEQSVSAKLTPEQLTAAARLYFRDTAEFPMLEQMDLTVLDASGHVRKTDKLSVDYLFQGYNPRSGTATAKVHGSISMWAALRGAKTFKASLNGSFLTLEAGSVVGANLADYEFEADDPSPAQDTILAKLVKKETCPPLAMTKVPEAYVPDRMCGAKVYQLDRHLRIQRFVYDASGLPAPVSIGPFGSCTLQRYHAEVEFQSVAMPGEGESFLVPKKVTTTLETNKGNILITSMYEPKPRGSQAAAASSSSSK